MQLIISNDRNIPLDEEARKDLAVLEGGTLTISIHPDGRRRRILYPSGAIFQITGDKHGRVTRMRREGVRGYVNPFKAGFELFYREKIQDL